MHKEFSTLFRIFPICFFLVSGGNYFAEWVGEIGTVILWILEMVML